jgi:Zn-dependent protease with chaperone function
MLVTIALALSELARQLLRVSRLERLLATLAAPDSASGLPSSVAKCALDLVDLEKPLCFCAGLIRPRIVISTGLLHQLSEPELQAVLAHEASHRRRRDPLRLLVARVAARGLYFIPTLRDLETASRLSTELAADQAALRLSGLAPLLAALRVLGSEDRVPALVSQMADSTLIGSRIDALLGMPAPRPARPARLAVSVLALGMTVALGFYVPSGTPAPHNLVPVHVLPVERR